MEKSLEELLDVDISYEGSPYKGDDYTTIILSVRIGNYKRHCVCIDKVMPLARIHRDALLDKAIKEMVHTIREDMRNGRLPEVYTSE